MDKVMIKALLKAHCTVEGNRWVFKQVDINEAAIELEQNFRKPDVSGSKELLQQMVTECVKVARGGGLSFEEEWQQWSNIGAIKKVLKLIDER